MLNLQKYPVTLQDPNVVLPQHPRRQSALKLLHGKPRGLSISNSQQHDEQPQLSPPFPHMSQSVAAIIFGDGSSESRRHLYPLTKRRSEGAIPIGANYRLIDAVVSNCINSNITKIYAITQFNSTSLNSHLSRAYSGVGLGKDGFVEVVAAYQSPENQAWFQGNADAVRRCLWMLGEYPVNEFLILPGHHLYKMEYQRLVEAHRKANADITIVALTADRARARRSGFGTLKLDPKNTVLKINCKEVESFENSEDVKCSAFLSTGIYLIRRDVMIKLLKECFPDENEIGEVVIQGAISLGMKVQAYLFDGYWEDMTSIGVFYRANMENTRKSNARFNFYDRDSPVYTLPRCLPPSIMSDSVITDSVIGDGCILNSCEIKRSVIGMRTRVEDGAMVDDSVIMGSDTYEWDVQRNSINGKSCAGVPPIGIGANTHIWKSIVDKNARIGKNVTIINRDSVQEGDREAEGYVIKDGIVVVLRGAVIPDGSIL
ncbi:inactive glucose-1-phosphate adenylyltransferase small subunit 2, chloroplastic [Punica granatum]|uniref:Inactive glucose-1-phosphate adenylyltransferase small subunit 2, chloroplastic n=1 Tax=Punica granatum TaxID=22663 RepID=A0A6P8D8N6_PUNGR|nr:inactive glucose-1-phosphate adenylyltransferase small subunit 2, chloroplastic [Punica granatum]